MTKKKVNGAVRTQKTEKKPLGKKKIAWLVVIFMVGAVYIDFKYTHWIASAFEMPVKKVHIKSEYKYVKKKDLQMMLKELMQGNFFMIDLAQTKTQLEAMPLIQNVSIRRIWPDSFSITVIEENPVARWKETELIDNDGKILSVENINEFIALPKFTGPDTSRKLILQKYPMFMQQLQHTHLQLREILLEERGAWQLIVETEQGRNILIMIGRRQVEEKMQRFLSVYENHLKNQIEEIEKIDIRYTNGISINKRAEENQAIDDNISMMN